MFLLKTTHFQYKQPFFCMKNLLFTFLSLFIIAEFAIAQSSGYSNVSSGESSKANKTVNCLKTLNEVLPQKEGFYIDKKEPKYYRKISKYYKKQKNLFDNYILNPSLQIFVEEVRSKTITLP